MGVFIILYIYLIAVAFLTSLLKNQYRYWVQAVASFFGLWIVLALRSPSCGVDLLQEDDGATYFSYYRAFTGVQLRGISDIVWGPWRESTGMELGWLLYNKIVSLFFPNFQMFLVVTAAIQMFLVGSVIYKYSSDIFLSSVIFLSFGIYLACFSTLRQTFALSLTFYTFTYLLDDKKIKFVLFTILASFFHISALAFLFVLPLSYINLTFKKAVICIGALLCILPILSEIVKFALLILFPGRFTSYEDHGGAITMFGVYIVIFLLSYLVNNDSRFMNLVRIMLLLAVFGQSLGYISTGAMTRIAMYFSIFFTLAIPMLIDVGVDVKSRPYVVVFASSLFFLFFYLTSKDGYLNVVPYNFVWEVPLSV